MSEVLRHECYTVHEANAAELAVALHEQYVETITVSVIDMVMPGASWTHVVDSILNRDPRASIIVTSGFSRDFVRHYLKRGAWGFLQKPYDGKQLLEAVASAGGRKRGAAPGAQ